jgi:hypothetical protein
MRYTTLNAPEVDGSRRSTHVQLTKQAIARAIQNDAKDAKDAKDVN